MCPFPLALGRGGEGDEKDGEGCHIKVKLVFHLFIILVIPFFRVYGNKYRDFKYTKKYHIIQIKSKYFYYIVNQLIILIFLVLQTIHYEFCAQKKRTISQKKFTRHLSSQNSAARTVKCHARSATEESAENKRHTLINDKISFHCNVFHFLLVLYA